MVPPDTSATVQPWWVHVAVNALIVPCCGWTTTTLSSGKTLPPPTGMSLVSASTFGPLALPWVAGFFAVDLP